MPSKKLSLSEHKKIFTFKIGGEAGWGQQAAGTLFAKACTRAGYYTFGYSEFPSIIRGGHVSFAVSVASHPISAIYEKVNLLIALNEDTIAMHAKELSDDGVIVYDSDKILAEDVDQLKKSKKQITHALPLGKLVKDNNLNKITSNVIAVGAACGLLEFDLKAIYEVIDYIFEHKSEEVRAMNKKAAKLGFDYAMEHFDPDNYHYHLRETSNGKSKYIISCNQALAMGAVASGCRVYVAYPMSPSSSILHQMAEWAPKTGMLVHQPEDEIAGVHMMLGAMHVGTRAMVGTSGGGFALMAEAVALAAITETPGVFAICSRPGPATGLPTWTEQGDLKFVVNAGHGDFPRIVLAPSDPQEAYSFTSLAFNLAEKYQLPVFILLDKYTSEGQFTLDGIDTAVKIERGKILTAADLAAYKEQYLRFKNMPDGVSPRALPGTPGGVHLVNSDEHDEYGYAIEGWHEPMRNIQVEKRARKLVSALKELPQPKVYGPKNAKITLLGWGSTKGPVLEAMRYLPHVNYVHVACPWPIQGTQVKRVLKGAKKVVAIENNFSGQFTHLLRAETGFTPHKQLLKYDGRQFWPMEIVEKLKKIK